MSSVQFSIANQVKDLLTAANDADPSAFVLPITPVVRAHVDLDTPAERQCIVLPAGFQSERADRGDGRLHTYYVDVFVLERIDGDPSSDSTVAWFDQRYTLIEQIENTDFSAVTAATFEESQIVHLLFEGADADDDFLFFQVIRLEFSDP